MNWFEYQERRTQKSIAHDLIEFPDIVVTESEMPEPEIPLIEDDHGR